MFRRILDICISSMVLLLFWPIFVIIGVVIKIETPGPVFFRQARVGKKGKEFMIYKFRKFPDRVNNGPAITVKNDKRMTRIGHLLERFKLDELPQFINVIKGEMSLVGPRPETPNFVAYYAPDDYRVLDASPGIFGINQLIYRREADSFPPGADPEEFYIKELMPKKIAIDLEYQSTRTIFKDLGILICCLLMVVYEPIASKIIKRKLHQDIPVNFAAVGMEK